MKRLKKQDNLVSLIQDVNLAIYDLKKKGFMSEESDIAFAIEEAKKLKECAYQIIESCDNILSL